MSRRLPRLARAFRGLRPTRATALRGTAVLTVLAAIGLGLAAPATANPVLPYSAGDPGTTGVLTPQRLASATVPANGQIELGTLTGRLGVPASAGGVELVISALTPTGSGLLAVSAGGVPATNPLSYRPGINTSLLVIQSLSGGTTGVLTNSGPTSVQAAVDLVTFLGAGASGGYTGSTNTLTPSRQVDTRTGKGVRAGQIGANQTVTAMIGGGGIPSGTTPVLLITALNARSAGTVTAYTNGTARSGYSVAYPGAGAGGSNTVVVSRDAANKVSFTNNGPTPVDIAVNLVGYVQVGGAARSGGLVPRPSYAVLDTRTGLGQTTKGAVAANASASAAVAGVDGLPSTNVNAALVQVTVIGPSSRGALRFYGDAEAAPTVPYTALFSAGLTYTYLAYAPVGLDGRIAFVNGSGASVQVHVDLVGYVAGDHGPTSPNTAVSRYVRNLSASNTAGNATTMGNEGCADAQLDQPGLAHVHLLDLGAQTLVAGTRGVQLTGTDVVLTDAQVEQAVEAYVSGYVGCRTVVDSVTVLAATNNDGVASDAVLGSAAGQDWGAVVNSIAQAAAGNAPGITVAGANDIENGFTGTEAQAEAWTSGFIAVGQGQYWYVGSADGCPTDQTHAVCDSQSNPAYDWTQAQYYRLAHGLSPNRIVVLPQIYYSANATQWAYISRTGSSGADRVTFAGALTEYAACQTSDSGCAGGYLQPAAAASALATALRSSSATTQQRLPVTTDLRIDSTATAPATSRRVTTAGVR